VVELGGFDEDFFPAWFEDVDLAARIGASGGKIRYAPASVFTHILGASVGRLGYRCFLSIYYRNLGLYLQKHHGARWALASRALLAASAPLRILALPLRRPRRARTRRDAAVGLWLLMLDALTNWSGGNSCFNRDEYDSTDGERTDA
jgi:GT2 family glycosyltransferase